jgi:adenylate cyclase
VCSKKQSRDRKIGNFFAELKRRKVYQAAVVYTVVGLGVLGAAELILDPLGLASARPFIVVMTLFGFPIALVLSWAYDLHPDSERHAIENISKQSAAAGNSGDSTHDLSIVVLPFDNLSPDSGDSYFSDGLTEEITSHLSFLRSLRVVSRSSARVIKNTRMDVRSISRKLDVRYVLEGSVRRSGDDLRITTQLIDADVDKHLWTETYEGTINDIFRIQEEVSKSIVEALDLRISAGEWRQLTRQSVNNIQIYECYIGARKEAYKITPEGLTRALRQLELGVETFGECELLDQGMAEVYLQTYEYGVKTDDEMLKMAEHIADKIQATYGDAISSQYIRGRIARLRGDNVGAFYHFKQVLEIEPNHVEALAFGVESGAVHCGRPDLVEDWLLRLETIDPLTPLPVLIVSNFYWASGRLEESIAAHERLIAIEPEAWATREIMCFVLISMGEETQADELISQIVAQGQVNADVTLATPLRHAINEDATGARDFLASGSTDYFSRDPEFQYFLAALLAKAGAHDESIEWLNHCVDRGWINYPLFAEGDVMLAGIRNDPRFKLILDRIKPKWEAFER